MGPVKKEEDIEEAHREAELGDNDLWCDPINDCWEECLLVAKIIRGEIKEENY